MRKLLYCILLILLLGGCEIFDLRDSEYPSAPPNWNSSTGTLQQLEQNLGYCYADSRNVVKYLGLFSSSYSFHFAPQDVVDYGIPATWTRSDEQDMLINLHSQASQITLSIEPSAVSPDEILANEARLFRTYQITVKNGGNLHNYTGSMELQVRRENGYWYIYRWYDYRIGNEPGWGKLKYDYSQ
jgi:hypothetical protein